MLADDITDSLPDGWAYYAIGGVAVLAIVIILIAVKVTDDTPSFPRKPGPMICTVCGGFIVRKFFIWGGDRMCPRCNGRMKNKVSKEAFKSKFG